MRSLDEQDETVAETAIASAAAWKGFILAFFNLFQIENQDTQSLKGDVLAKGFFGRSGAIGHRLDFLGSVGYQNRVELFPRGVGGNHE